MPRRALIERETIQQHAERPPIFQDQTGRRARLVSLVLAIALVAVVSGVVWAKYMATAPLRKPALTSGLEFPRQLAQAMQACQHGSAAPQPSNIPLLGDGIFRRVVEVRPQDANLYAYDVFSGQQLRQLTRLEQERMVGCRYAIDLYGEVPDHTLVLTFDDGPDPVWTARLLALQQAYGRAGYTVPYTFFAIGQSVLAHPEVVQQAVRNGNVMGNHTLNHIDFKRATDAQAREELVATAHILKAVSHTDTQLFRLPYGGDDPASVRADVYGLLVAQQLGLVEAGFDYDTSDFRYNAATPIPALNLDGAGKVVVMHDGGGNREATIQFVNQLVRQGIDRGYRFTTVNQLLPSAERAARPAQLGPADYSSYWWYLGKAALTGRWMQRVLLYALTVVVVASFGIIGLAMVGRWRAGGLRRRHVRRRKARGATELHAAPVCVLVPAWNEVKTLPGTLANVFASNYPPERLQVVVIENGSTDGTRALLLGELKDRYGDRLTPLYRDEPGKASALNYALFMVVSPSGERIGTRTIADGHHYPRLVRCDTGTILPLRQGPGGKLIGLDGDAIHDWRWLIDREAIGMTVDADTTLDPQAIAELVWPFENPRVEMVAGDIRVANPGRNPWQWLLIHWQRVDYRIGIGLRRLAEYAVGAITIVPGALSAFRMGTVRDAGGFPEQASNADDFYLRMLVERIKPRCQVVQSLRAIACTEAPERWYGKGSLCAQRERWTVGPLQVIWASRDIMCRPWRHGRLAWLTLPYAAVAFFAQMVLLPIGYLIGVMAILDGRGLMVVLYYSGFALVHLVMSVISMATLRSWSASDLLVSLYHRPLNDVLSFYLTWRVLRAILLGRPQQWVEQRRTGRGTVGTMAQPAVLAGAAAEAR